MNAKVGIALLRTEFQQIAGIPIQDWSEGYAAHGADIRLRAGKEWYTIEFQAAANTEQIGSALRKLAARSQQSDIPLLVVPYMGQAGRELCRGVGISWLDLSGNAEITGATQHIRVLGEANRYKRAGRPESLFAPRSARAVRVFLMDTQRVWRQAELAQTTGLSTGYLSRLLPRYEEAGFLQCERGERTLHYRVTRPDALLDAWRADYEFNSHRTLRGHTAARSGPELLRELSAALTRQRVKYAATGLAGAWLWEPFAAFRTVTLYLSEWPSPEILAQIGFHEGARGSNTWLVLPNDAGVFTGSGERNGICCVSPVQVYLDMKGQPERAEEAGAELRRVHLDWTGTGQESQT